MTTLRKLPTQAPTTKARAGKNHGSEAEKSARTDMRAEDSDVAKGESQTPLRRAASAAARMTGAVSAAGAPVQISSDFAPWCTSMDSPLAWGIFNLRAWASKAVSGRL